MQTSLTLPCLCTVEVTLRNGDIDDCGRTACLVSEGGVAYCLECIDGSMLCAGDIVEATDEARAAVELESANLAKHWARQTRLAAWTCTERPSVSAAEQLSICADNLAMVSRKGAA